MARKFQPKIGATIVTLLALCVLVGLGVWQLQRLAWKTTLIATVQQRMEEAAAPLPETIADLEAFEYRRVTMGGTYLYDHEFLVKPRTLDGKVGYHLVTPLQRLSGGIVFVNRGFVSDDHMQDISRPSGVVQVDGIVTLPKKYKFTPENVPDKNDWYWSDITAMAKSAGVENALPLMVQIQLNPVGKYPVPQSVTANLPNDHARYATFWFAMGLILIVIYFIFHWREEKHASL